MVLPQMTQEQAWSEAHFILNGLAGPHPTHNNKDCATSRVSMYVCMYVCMYVGRQLQALLVKLLPARQGVIKLIRGQLLC